MAVGAAALHDRADVGKPLAIAGSMTGCIGKELNREAGVGNVVHRAVDHGGGGVCGGATQDRKVQPVVGTNVSIAKIVRGDAVAAQVNPQRRIAKDRIAEDSIASRPVTGDL